MSRRIRSRNAGRTESTMNPLSPAPFARRLRVEPLEDRRMLSVTLFVDADAPAGGDGLGWGSAYGDLQAALNEAETRNADAVSENDVDSIWIAEGVYRPSTQLEPGDPRSATFSLVDKVTVYGGFSGTETTLEERDFSAHVTTLSGDLGTLEDSPDNAYTVVYCGEDVEAGVDGVWIVDGRADGSSTSSHRERENGGGIYSSGTLTVINSTLVRNLAGSGGGIYCDYGRLTVADSTLAGNSAGRGGGIYSSGTLTVTNSTFSGNSATYGGGIYNHPGTLTVTDSTISGNSAHSGGGIYSYSGTVTVAGSTLSGNSTGLYGYGGGIHNRGTMTVTGSTISGNSATHGGGIHSSGTLTVVNSTLSGNSAEGDSDGSGGGIRNDSGTLTLTNSTLSGNSTYNRGGGIYSSDLSSATTLNNTIVVENVASSGPDIYHGFGSLSGSHNLVGDGTGQSSLVQGKNGNLVGTAASPIDPHLSDWSELGNGRWGHYLLPGSPALNAGQNTLAVDAAGQSLVEDISGSARIQNGAVDIGALEGTMAGKPAQTYVVTSLDRTIAQDGVLTFLEAFEAANRNQPVGDAPAGSFTEPDVIRFAEGLSGTVLLEEGELVIHGDLNIEGPEAAQLAFDAEGTSRVFLIEPGVRANLSGMAITGGSAGAGGGIYSNYGTLTVTNCTLSGNSATGYLGSGGGIHSSGTLTVTNSTLSGNSTSYYGGGLCNDRGTLTLTNSTLSRNSAYEDGGGIYISGVSSTTTLNNTIVTGNVAPSGPDVYDDPDYPGTLSGSHSLIGDGSGQSSLVQDENDNQVGTAPSPIDPRLSDWSELNNGRWGYYLLPGSPAIDAGENTLAVDAAGRLLTQDLSGNARIQNGTVDIGALEWAMVGNPAQVYVVTSLDRTIAEDGVLTFSEAFEAANRNQPVGDAPAGSFAEPDVIRFNEGLSGTVLLEDGELVIHGDLSIEGPGATLLTFDAGGASRLFLIERDVSANLSGITITGGSAGTGGGIYNDYGTLTVTNSTLSGNSAAGGSDGSGGGIYSSGTLTVANSTLSGNSATGNPAIEQSGGAGGGIYSSGTLTVTGSTLSGNSAIGNLGGAGGGIRSSGTLTVANSTVSGNLAMGYRTFGGGISSSGTVTITNSTVSGNSVTMAPEGVEGFGVGGGISSSGTLTVANSTLSGNSVDTFPGSGGAIDNSGTLTVTDSTLSRNSADSGGGINNSSMLMVINSTLSDNSAGSGGGICNHSGTLTVTNSTLSGNSTTGYYGSGGGIRNYSGTLTVTNSTLSGNSATGYYGSGGGISSSHGSSTTTLNNTIVAGNVASSVADIDHESGVLSGSHNLIGDGSGQSALVQGESGNQIGTSISLIDPRLSDWTELDNGRWGYYLLPGSPALDAGENTLAVDAAGQPLVEDISGGPRIRNDAVDIGAVEGPTAGSPAAVYVVTSLDRTIAENGVLTFLEAFEAANRNQPVGDAPAGSFAEPDVIRFGEGLSGTVLLEDGGTGNSWGPEH